MADYFLIQDSPGLTVYAFKVVTDGYKPKLALTSKEQLTITGKLDVQRGPVIRAWDYTVKVYGTITGTFTSSPGGSKVTLTTIYWGSLADLKSLFVKNQRFAFRDFDGSEYYIYFTGELNDKPLTADVSGNSSYHHVQLTFRESIE